MNNSKPGALFVVPPFATLGPPAGMAYILGYLRDKQCNDFSFTDLRLGMPSTFAPTFVNTGVFGEGYVMDIPDLPLVLKLIKGFKNNVVQADTIIEDYTLERGMSQIYLRDYLNCMHNYLHACAEQTDAKVVGCSTWTTNYLTTLIFCLYLKKKKNPPIIILGGPQTTQSEASANLALYSGLADYIVLGEGESAFYELYNSLGTNQPVPGVKCLSWDGTNKPLLKMDKIALPDYDQMPIRNYENVELPFVLYHFSRGCTDKCSFCSEWKFWEHFRPSDVGQTIEGIKELMSKYDIKYIGFTDSLLNGHHNRLMSFAEEMVKLNTPVQWGGFMRADMNETDAKLLKKAGCRDVFVGIESMSTDTLNLMNKRRTEPQNIEALRAFLDADIGVAAGLIPGFPGDSRKSFIHTIKIFTELMAKYPNTFRTNVDPFTVSPGQPMYNELSHYGLVGVPWSDEVLNIVPELRPYTENMHCSVEGNNQGMERSGRLKMVQGIRVDTAVRIDIFDYYGEEFITRFGFEFDPLIEGWNIARIKNFNGCIYTLIVSDREKKLIDKQNHDILNDRYIMSIINGIESHHLVKPFDVNRINSGGYTNVINEETEFILSPFVVARVINEILYIVEIIEPRSIILDSSYILFIEGLIEESHTLESILEFSKLDIDSCKRIINLLLEQGMLLSIQPTINLISEGGVIVENRDHN